MRLVLRRCGDGLGQSWERYTTTDGDGRFRFRELPRGTYALEVPTWHPGQSHEPSYPEPGLIEVRDSHCNVNLLLHPASVLSLDWSRRSTSAFMKIEATSDAPWCRIQDSLWSWRRGYWEFTEGRGCSLRGKRSWGRQRLALPPGTYRVSIAAGDEIIQVEEIELKVGESSTIVVR